MNTDIVSIDAITIEELLEKTLVPVMSDAETPPPEVSLSITRRFGIVDLWKIRSTKKHFSIYR